VKNYHYLSILGNSPETSICPKMHEIRSLAGKRSDNRSDRAFPHFIMALEEGVLNQGGTDLAMKFTSRDSGSRCGVASQDAAKLLTDA
jgi:hypothetical protein